MNGGDGARALVDSDLRQMDQEVQAMLHGALRAFVDRDPDGARAILVRDDSVDGHCATIIAKMETYIASHPSDVSTGLRIMTVAKALERIADHATNVGEEVIFMVRGRTSATAWRPARRISERHPVRDGRPIEADHHRGSGRA